MSCFNCGTTANVSRYSFDLDLPQIVACDVCVLALSMGDEKTLKAMHRPRPPARMTR